MPVSLRQAVARFDLGLIALVGSLIGARVAYVATHWDYYGFRPEEWIWIWQGGLPWIGALLGSLLLLGILNFLIYHSFGLILDILAIPALFVGISAWIGCWLSGCAYGYTLDIRGILPPSPDYFGVMGARWPTQIVGALLCFIALLVLISPKVPVRKAGLPGSLAILSIALSSFVLSYTRADPIRTLLGVRLDTIGSAFGVILAMVCIIYFTYQNKNRS
jgi:phosphatidylglycerol:prolipoprotein diacylglycerol transferase